MHNYESSGIIGGRAQTVETGTAKAPDTVVDRLGRSISMTEGSVNRMEVLADRLCGSVPQSVSDQKASAGGTVGLFGDIGRGADHLASLAARAEAALDRIFNNLN